MIARSVQPLMRAIAWKLERPRNQRARPPRNCRNSTSRLMSCVLGSGHVLQDEISRWTQGLASWRSLVLRYFHNHARKKEMCLPLITVDDTVFSQQSAQISFQWYDSLLLLCERFLLVLATNIIPCYLGTYERAHSRRCFGRWREALCTIPLTFSPEADEISVETREPIIVPCAHRLE